MFGWPRKKKINLRIINVSQLVGCIKQYLYISEFYIIICEIEYGIKIRV